MITAIDKQPRRKRADISLDDAAVFSLRLDVILAKGLSVGGEIGAQRRRELEEEDQQLEAVDAALRLLAMGPRSERDLRDRLRRRGMARAAVDFAVGRMHGLGYIDDAAFARSVVESRQQSMPRSRRALAFELGRRGVGRELAAEAVAGLRDDDAAMQAAQRRLRSLAGLDRAAFSRRLGAFLAGRGFSYQVARSTIEQCWTLVSTSEDAT
jgi:regulatory protein